MLAIKKETDYAVRTVLHLASLGEGAQVQVRDVATQRLLPPSFIRRIVARLSASGILTTTRGVGGGIQLARPASEISLLDVLRAMEDGVALNRCAEGLHTCPLLESCPAHAAWADATAVLEAHLGGVRFDALARSGRRHAAAHRVMVGTPQAQPAGALPARRSARR